MKSTKGIVMKTLEEIDRNFKAMELNGIPLRFYPVNAAPFVVEGFPWKHPEKEYYRLPAGMTVSDVSEGALSLANHTSGGAIRFRTDSAHIALKADLINSCDMPHMPKIGQNGFDCYRLTGRDPHVVGISRAPQLANCHLETMTGENPAGELCLFQINMPLYGGAEHIWIGLDPDARLLPPDPHKITKPILFYGSSITQGGCASRPGNAYTTALCRELDAPQINLGFAGNGRGEPAMAHAIASLDLAAFVYDYDHNAPTPEHLEQTHEPFFRIIREAHPGLPVLFLSKCDFKPEYADDFKRRDIIRRTYENALASGDRNVAYIDGETLFAGDRRWDCTVDRCHPNDLGFYRMASVIAPVLRKLIENAR